RFGAAGIVDLEIRPQHPDQGVKGSEATQREASPLVVAHAAALQPTPQLGEQPRLSRSGSADDPDDLPCAPGRHRLQVEERLDLALSTEEWAQPGSRLASRALTRRAESRDAKCAPGVPGSLDGLEPHPRLDLAGDPARCHDVAWRGAA